MNNQFSLRISMRLLLNHVQTTGDAVRRML